MTSTETKTTKLKTTNYKDYDPFICKNIQFHWSIRYYDSEPTLNMDSDPNDIKKEGGCGNPWNLIEDLGIRQEILDHRPPRNKTIETIESKPKKQIQFLNTEQLKKRLYDLIAADCWHVFTLNDKRETIHNYFNSFESNDYGGLERTKLIENSDPLLSDLENGHSVSIILNDHFLDYVYKKIPNQDLYVECEIMYKLRNNLI